MTREEMNQLLEFADTVEMDIAEIQSNIYATDEEYDDLVLYGLMSLEGVIRNFGDAVRFQDDQMTMEEFDTQIKAKPETKRGEATEEKDNK